MVHHSIEVLILAYYYGLMCANLLFEDVVMISELVQIKTGNQVITPLLPLGCALFIEDNT